MEQEHIQLSYQQLLMILDNSYDEICAIDDEGKIIYSNKAVERNYEYSVSDILGKTAFECYQKYNYAPFLTPIVFHERKTITTEQLTNSGKKMVITAVPVLDSMGKLEMVIMNTRDMDHLQKIKHDLVKAQQLSDLYYLNSGINPQEAECLNQMTSKSAAFLNRVETARQVAPTNANILLLGETGTGKTLMAKFIHQNSAVKNGPFFSVNCAAIPEHLLESELFGYKKGAFTGASADKQGIFDLAADGTLFLDEIAEIPLQMQAKLLQAIQERSYLPIGGSSYRQLRSRIIAATNKDLAQEVRQGRFRSDLYYRLNVIEIDMPPLRERHGDVSALARFFVAGFNEQYKTYHSFDQEALALLEQYPWPGNIRQLENFVERLVLTVGEEEIQTRHLPPLLSHIYEEGDGSQPSLAQAGASLSATEPHSADWQALSPPLPCSLEGELERLTQKLVLAAVAEYGSSRKVAQALGISQNKASRLIRKYRDCL